MTEFYGSVAEADAYHAGRANAHWGGTPEAKQAAMRRASVYIDGRYRKEFPGSKIGGRAQLREWPRKGAVDYEGHPIASDSVPIEVEHATYEAAMRELVEPGSLSPDYVASLLVKRETIGPLTTEYAIPTGSVADAAAAVRPVVTLIDDILDPVLRVAYRLPGVMVV